MILHLEQQVCSLECSKRLKSLGFTQESLFYWIDYIHDYDFRRLVFAKKGFYDSDNYGVYSAYTVAELGEFCKKWQLPYRFENENGKHFWRDPNNLSSKYDTEVEARSGMLIYLKDNKLI